MRRGGVRGIGRSTWSNRWTWNSSERSSFRNSTVFLSLEREEWQEAARSVLADLEAKLSPLSARIFRMRYFDGKSIPEIAADVGHSVDCVKMRLRRARHLLEQDLRHRESGRP